MSYGVICECWRCTGQPKPKRQNLAKETSKGHGMSGSGEYVVWASMKSRCHNPKSGNYAYYGGRGIKVCESWTNSFEQFYKDMGPRPPHMTIDRIDPNGNYGPSNCRWATRSQQQANQRERAGKLSPITAFGKTQTLKEWSRELRIPRIRLYARLYHGWSVERALTFKPKRSLIKSRPIPYEQRNKR